MTRRPRILVTCATGLVGSHVLQSLRARGVPALGASRHAAGDGWVPLDFDRPASFDAALDGIDTVMLIPPPRAERADIAVLPFIDAMARRGVRKVCLLSALGAGNRSGFSMRRLEISVEWSGLDWVHVRPNFFMQMLTQPPLANELRDHDSLSLPLGDAGVAWVDARDVAEVLAHVLTNPMLRQVAIELSGPETLSHLDLVTIIGSACERPLRNIDLTGTSALALLRSREFSLDQVRRAMRFYALVCQGECAQPDRIAVRLLGRPLRRFVDFAHEHRQCWRKPQLEALAE